MNEEWTKSVLILSGGMDSATLLYELFNSKIYPYTLTFDYGQRHRKEIDCAKLLAGKLGVPNVVADLSGLKQFFKGSSQTDDVEVPEGHYEEESMKKTVVPNRNMIMLSVAISHAISLGVSEVFYGAHAGDHAIYPDCRPEFVDAMQRAALLCDWSPITIHAPYLDISKTDILRKGISMQVPYELTWTCYKGLQKPCGKCGSCQERAEAFKKNDLLDPANV